MPVSNIELRDMLSATLKNFPVNEFEYAFQFQSYEALSKWFKTDKKQLDSGTSIKRFIVLSDNGTARHFLPYERTEVGVGDTLSEIEAPWALSRVPWVTNRQEILRNRAGARIIDLVKLRRLDATVSLAELIESAAWSLPLNSSDKRSPRGLPYWIVKMNAADAAANSRGFLGKNPVYRDNSVAADCGGLDSGDASSLVGKERWRNWAAKYPNAGFDSGTVDEMRYAFHRLNFRPPATVQGAPEVGENYRIYMNVDTLVAYEKLITSLNDVNIGADLGKYQGQTAFNRIPIIPIAQLDADTSDPIYLVNHFYFMPYVMSGDWMREEGPLFDANQPDVFTTWLNCQYQFFLKNRRSGGGVISKIAA